MRKAVCLAVCMLLFASVLGACAKKNLVPLQVLDISIGNEIRTRVERDPELKAFAIRVLVFQGRVILSGVVPDKESMLRLIGIAEGVKGVTAVINNLELQRTG
jgi:osmotically-inducible protein OsmY